MIYELEHNSRTVGVDNPSVGEKVKELYLSFCKSEIVVTDIRSAEMSKVVENTYRDVNIALANELSLFCEKARIDFKDIKKAANTQPYCHLHEPGIGVGGNCIPYNPYFLIDMAEEIGVDLSLVDWIGWKVNNVIGAVQGDQEGMILGKQV